MAATTEADAVRAHFLGYGPLCWVGTCAETACSGGVCLLVHSGESDIRASDVGEMALTDPS